MVRHLARPQLVPNDAWLVVVFFAVVLLFLSGCGGSSAPKPASAPSTTSGTVAAQPSNDQLNSQRIAELENERDRALLQANDAQAQATASRERSEKAVKGLVQRNDFEDAMWAKLDRIDARMKTIRFESAHLAPDVRLKVRHSLEELTERRNTVEREIHRVHGVPVADFDGYARDVEQSINAVSRDVESIQLK